MDKSSFHIKPVFRSKTLMLKHCVSRGLSCASQGAMHRRVSARGSFLTGRLLEQRRDLSAQVSVADAEAEKEVSAKVSKLAEEILELNLMEISELSNVLKDKLGLDALPMAGAVAMAPGAAAPAGGAAAEEPVEEKTKFDVKLESFDSSSKIQVIKEVRAATELGLKEAKDLVEKAPVVILEDVAKDEAEELKSKLEEVGATVTVS